MLFTDLHKLSPRLPHGSLYSCFLGTRNDITCGGKVSEPVLLSLAKQLKTAQEHAQVEKLSTMIGSVTPPAADTSKVYPTYITT